MRIRLYKIIAGLIGVVLLHACKDEIPKATPVQFSDAVAGNITEFSAQISSSITKLGNQDITEHGFAVSKGGNEPEVDEKSIKKGPVDIALPAPVTFTGTLSGLEANTEYRVRPYAITTGGTSFGKTVAFKTLEISQPAIKTDGVEAVNHNSAKLNGSVTAKGTHAISEYGLVWHTAANPATALTTKTSVKANITQFPFNFSANAGNLQPNTEYHFRAYVIANGVTTYGADMTFKTTAVIQPGITTGNADNITINSARLAGSVTKAGTYPVTERGVVWATSANPTTANSKAPIAGNVTTFPNNYTVNAGALSVNTTYNYRAYVISNGVTTYGENKTFKTAEVVQPAVQTGAAGSIGVSTAKLSGTITRGGSYNITERGVVWGTAANPTTANSKGSVAGNVTNFPHNFTVDANGLAANTTYNYRAYVISNGVTTYGENKTFKTTSVVEPGVQTGNATSIGINTAKLGGTLTSGGTYPVTERGVVWGTSANPTTSGSKASVAGNVTSFPHNYTVDANSLSANTTYHFRAYVISNGQVRYGADKTFRTLGNPSLRTDAYTLRSVPYPNCPPQTICGGTQYIKFNGTVTGWGGYRYPGQVGFLVGRDRQIGNIVLTPIMDVSSSASLGVYANHKKNINPPGANQALMIPYSFSIEIENKSVFTGSATGKYYYRAYIVTPDGKTHYGDTKTVTFTSGPVN